MLNFLKLRWKILAELMVAVLVIMPLLAYLEAGGVAHL